MQARGVRRKYGSIAVAKAAGLSLRQFYYWVDVLQAVTPVRQQHGRRRFARFSHTDIRTLRTVKRLVEEGYTLRAAVRNAQRRSPPTAL